MSISLHCESCKRKIKAPNTAGGKWGKCPHCGHKNYIPLPPAPPEEELKLKPLDESSETQYGRLMKETHNLTKDILGETAMDEQADLPDEISEKEVIRQVIFYVRNMAEGRLERAEEIAAFLGNYPEKSADVIERMARTTRPEQELADIPPKLLAGFLKNLKNQVQS